MNNKFKTIIMDIKKTNDGYLEDFSQWNIEVGTAIAKEEGIEMTDDHWAVITWIQEQVNSDKALSIRSVKKSGVVDIKGFYKLFPGGPLKISTRIAGVEKPKSCI